MILLEFTSRPAAGEIGVAEILRTRPEVEDIYIYNDWFEDDDAEELGPALAGNTSLDMIFLCDCSIGARGLRSIGGALKVNETLGALILTDIDIGDAGADIMADALVSSNLSLHLVGLVSCGIGAVGAKAIAKAYEINTRLSVLIMDDNKIGDEGASILADVIASRKSKLVISLKKNGWHLGCDIGEQGALALGRAWGTNLALPLDYAVVEGVDGVHEEAERIRGLVLERRDKLVAFGMATVPRLGGIRAANAGPNTRSSTSKECVFRFMNKDVLRLIGEAYGDY